MWRFSSKPNECRVKTGCWDLSIENMSAMLYGTSIHLQRAETHTHTQTPHIHTHTHTHSHPPPPHTHLLLLTLLTPITPPCWQSFPQPGHSERSPAACCTFTLPQQPLSLRSSVHNVHTQLLFCVLLWDVKMPSPSDQKKDEKRLKLVETQPPLWKIAATRGVHAF